MDSDSSVSAVGNLDVGPLIVTTASNRHHLGAAGLDAETALEHLAGDTERLAIGRSRTPDRSM